MFSLFKKKLDFDVLSELIEQRPFSGTPISIIGSSPSRKARFVSNVLAPMAVEAGESFSVLRNSEGLLLEQCILERSQIGHSILSVETHTNIELSDHLIEIVGKQSIEKPTHIIIRYPDDALHYESRSDLENRFINGCLSAFFRNKAKPLQDDSITVGPDAVPIDVQGKRSPVFLGDINRYLGDSEFAGYVFVCLSQLRALGYQSFHNYAPLSDVDFGTKLWEVSMANSLCRILIESDLVRAKEISTELTRYIDAEFHDEDAAFANWHNNDIGSEFVCGIYSDKKGLIKPRFIKLG